MRTLRSLVAMGLLIAANFALAAEVPNLSTPVVRGAIGERMHAYLRWGEQFGSPESLWSPWTKRSCCISRTAWPIVKTER